MFVKSLRNCFDYGQLTLGTVNLRGTVCFASTSKPTCPSRLLWTSAVTRLFAT